jgi:hypothetical protein
MAAIDAGVRELVALLNSIPGVATRASCEGMSRARAPHRHGDLAYVLFRYPMPLRLQEFLVVELGTVARIDGDGVYSRWPSRNRVFIERFTDAAHTYQGRASGRQRSVRWPLARLRARIARELSQGERTRVALCLACAQLAAARHHPSHNLVPLLDLAPDQEALWLEEFVTQPGNGLDAALIAADGWERVAVRTLRGDFGAAFRQRWLRYRARMVAGLATRQMRVGVESARRLGVDLDFVYDQSHAVFAWSLD